MLPSLGSPGIPTNGKGACWPELGAVCPSSLHMIFGASGASSPAKSESGRLPRAKRCAWRRPWPPSWARVVLSLRSCGRRAFLVERLGNDDFLDAVRAEAGESQDSGGQRSVRWLYLEALLDEAVDAYRRWRCGIQFHACQRLDTNRLEIGRSRRKAARQTGRISCGTFSLCLFSVLVQEFEQFLRSHALVYHAAQRESHRRIARR